MALQETATIAAALLVKATALAARWAGATRRHAITAMTKSSEHDSDTEIAMLRDRIEQLELQAAILRKHVGKHAKSPRYTLAERLHVLWFVEYFQIPRRRVSQYFGIARSTLYRWLRRIGDTRAGPRVPHNRTSADIAALVWQVARGNDWGRVRIAGQLALLGVFLAPSTARKILSRPEPEPTAADSEPSPTARSESGSETSRSVRACYPNHVWSIDCTTVLRLGLWPTQVFVAIDHFSRRLLTAAPLEGPNAGWVCSALESALARYGPPKHIISDMHPVFRGEAVRELLGSWSVEHRFGAVGKHGSIAVTERAIWTLKYEWLFRVPLIKSFAHLERLCAQFMEWHNAWRPHMTLGGGRPDDVYRRDLPEPVHRAAKSVPPRIERRDFSETRVTGLRLPRAA